MIELSNTLYIGGSLVETIKRKISVLGECAGLDTDELDINLNNVASLIERASVAVISLIIRPEDMNNVICYYCGPAPKCVNTDGNAKDTIQVTPHMVYNSQSKLCGGTQESVMQFF